MFGTVWALLHEERSIGSDGVSFSQRRERDQSFVKRLRDGDGSAKEGAGPGAGPRGLQFMGLWRGWRVGFWGLVGVWTAAACGGGGGVEF